jgi:prepilin-type N-terminal cleavage/methylation domain-containing protein
MKTNNSAGFTLTEVAVATAVTAICFIGLYAATTQCMKQVWSAREVSRAAQAANYELETLRTAAWSNITAYGSSYTLSTNSNPALSLLNNGGGTVMLTPINGNTNLLQATVTLTWTGYQGNRNKTLSSAAVISQHGFLR